ncbi:alpha/beta fold hydrolase [Flavobacterium aquatile]|uniref:Homoserine acetyltransferase n=1 Tax=Flavobacterium aquatile LMG 4008 = ATCC 11947 TaxID=1453498 RepID=A0A095SXW2_9FLAO|nr:alpha/beta fold hydrolase [Flavobacterium aquatile]KGD69412.1 homoserine acetyltransferase [Flavobacterium aquatile LMG 4008 = ATCC 11947]OXA66133.1 homoserine acetyltransferase [Flavobacterium aquatile LMG 4008 = ATCC 11947]GEC77619.1 homoserine O-acetyltransferase [Flavobacterium aquatile]
MLQKIEILNFKLENGKVLTKTPLFYQTFGQPIGNAPIVIVNHALTGNSYVTGENGWWNDLIGIDKIIDTNNFTIIAFDIPGNGFDGNPENLITNYKDFTAKDIASIFLEGINVLKIESVFALIGGSLGGGIAWEMANLQPDKFQNLIPIATDWKASDWVIANVLVQDQILNNSDNPIVDARLHAMLLYRTPQSFKKKFNRNKKADLNDFQIENWLVNHGLKLQNRFKLAAYKLMNHLLKTIDITKETNDFAVSARKISANIHIVSVDTDYFFIPDENRETFEILEPIKQNVFYHEIKSIHGHDAFLIEFDQLAQILEPIFNKQKHQNYVNA